MNATLLVDAIVRQTVVLIATLATGAGQRPSLSHIADQVFAELVRALKEQGLSNKLVADMFGIALRTYHTRVAQLAESHSQQGRSLWEAVYGLIQAKGQVGRAAVLDSFQSDDPAMVRAVLRDLVGSGLVYKTGRGERTCYRAPSSNDPTELSRAGVTLERMVLVALHRHGPASDSELRELLPVDDDGEWTRALSQLEADGLLVREGTGDAVRYRCERCIIPFGDEVGWEAAVFDHYQAMVAALVTKLRLGTRRAGLADQIGGSTFVFDLYDGHPMQSEVLGFLKAMRTHGLELRRRLDDHDDNHPRPVAAAAMRVVAYVGQTITEADGEEHHG